MCNDSHVASIRPPEVYQIYEFLKPKGLTTANRHMEKLSHVFTKAVEWGVVADHPMTNRKFVKQHPKLKKVYVTDEQVAQAVSMAPDMIVSYVRLKLMTGLRMTDMLQLKWSDYDENGLHVAPSKTALSSGIALVLTRSPRLDEVLRELKAQNPLDIPQYVFTTREGKPYIKADKSATAFRSMWQRWMHRVEKQHGFKFTERSLRVKAGSDAKSDQAAAEMLAHTSTLTTIRHYRAKEREINTGD